MNKRGFTLLELLVVVANFTVIAAAGALLFVTGQAAWSTTDTQIRLQQNLRQTLQRISLELQESGTDQDGALQVTILDNTGVNGTDVIRFSVPLCVCGTSAIDQNGNVKSWGAPSVWGQAGCTNNIVIETNGKVKICHLPPGNPENPQDLQVAPSAVNAHLAHGDRLGECAGCDPVNYTNRFIEYRMNAQNQLVRRVLDNALVLLREDIFAERLTDFQASFNAGQTIVILTVQLTGQTNQNRQIVMTRSLNAVLKNRN